MAVAAVAVAERVVAVAGSGGVVAVAGSDVVVAVAEAAVVVVLGWTTAAERHRPPGTAEVVEAAEAPLIFPASYQGRGDRRADALSHQNTEDERTGTGRYDFVGRCGRSDSQDGRGCRSRWCRTKASNRKCRSRNDGR